MATAASLGIFAAHRRMWPDPLAGAVIAKHPPSRALCPFQPTPSVALLKLKTDC